MHLLDIIRTISLTLAGLSILLLLSIVIVRVQTERSLLKKMEFRRRAMPHLSAWLGGVESRETLLGILGRERLLSRDLLMEQSNALGSRDRAKLTPIFTALSFADAELEALHSRNWHHRLMAAEQISYLPGESQIKPLLLALDDPILDVRLAAALSLARLGCAESVEPIIRSLELPGEISQRRIAEILSVLGEKAEDPILRILGDPLSPPRVLSVAARTAGVLRLNHSVELLAKLLTHPDSEVRLNAVRSLGSIGTPSVAPRIAGLAGDSTNEVRATVMEALGRLGDPSAIPQLTKALSDQDWWVRFHASTSLLRLGSAGISALRDAATSHPDPFARDMSRGALQGSGLLTSMPEMITEEKS